MFRRLREKVQRSKIVYRKDSQAAQGNRDALGGLPFEVWDIVFRHLETHDRASLALSCHHLYDMVGPEVWDELKTNKRDRYELLLKSQDRHYPRHQLCWHCAKFHAGAVEARTRASSAPSNDWCNPVRGSMPVHPCPEQVKDPKAFKFPDELVLFRSDQGQVPWWLVQQIMRAHRLGSKYGLHAGILNRTDKKSMGRVAACVNGSKARIVEGRLLMKVSTVSGQLDVRSDKPNFDDIIRTTHTCGHYYKMPAMQKACNVALTDLRDGKSGTSPLYRCSYCPTELQVSIKRAAESELSSARHTYGGSAPGFVMIVERWQDLGKGLYPDDDEWTGLTRSWKNPKRGARNTVGIKGRFEGTDRGEKAVPIGADDGDDRWAMQAMM